MKTTKKKKIVIAAVAVSVIAVVTGVILLGIWLGTRADVLALTGMQTYYPPSESYVTVDRGFDYYLGHPDLVYFKGKLITAYPLGHGKGQIAMKTSSDLGKTWDPIDETELPESFKYSQETPTLYKLEFTDGTEKVLLVSGCPSWSDDDEYYANGFNFSLSDDGVNYTEFQNAYGVEWANSMPDRGDPLYDSYPEDELPNFDENGKVLPYDVIVAMSSLTRLRGENGNYIDKWMGTFHDYDFYNYVSYLTFDDNGLPQWSVPKKFLSAQREVEAAADLCELEVYRAPEGELILLGRSNSRTMNSLISVSYDEGRTWSALKELPYCLTGDRHKAEYDPISGKMLVSFRLYLPKVKPHALSRYTETGGYWVAWCGTPSDLLDYATDPTKDKSAPFGDKLLVLGKTNDGLSDCGYAGLQIIDGTAVSVSYASVYTDKIISLTIFRRSDGISFPKTVRECPMSSDWLFPFRRRSRANRSQTGSCRRRERQVFS